MFKGQLAAVVGGLGLAMTTAGWAGPAITLDWDDVAVAQDECLARAEKAVRGAGFHAMEKTTETRFGTHGGYTGAIRCIAEKHMVIFMATGTSQVQTSNYAGELHRAFGGK